MAPRERTHGRGFATRAIHAGERPDPVTHAHNTPIYATATFAFDSAAEKEDAVDRAMEWDPTSYFYSRTANPTTRANPSASFDRPLGSTKPSGPTWAAISSFT